jgi:pimeloyl-ACP methyl ester carboxylesterase
VTITGAAESSQVDARTSRTFILVHGARHGAWCWRRVADLLESQGHKVFAPTLTGLGDRSHLLSEYVDLTTHIMDAVNLFKWEDLQNVVLCGHSYAGYVISGAVEHVGSRVSSIVYLDAFYPANGDSMASSHERAAAMVKKVQEESGHAVPPIPATAFNVNEREASPRPCAAIRRWRTALSGRSSRRSPKGPRSRAAGSGHRGPQCEAVCGAPNPATANR